MVEVGDKVFVAPLYNQKDNIAVITGPAGAGAVLNEGNYNTWTFEWQKNVLYKISGAYTSDFPGNGTNSQLNFFVDDSNDVIHATWKDLVSDNSRYGIFACADFANLLVSPDAATGLTVPVYDLSVMAEGWKFGTVYGSYGISRSIQSYTLLATKGAAGHEDGLNVYKNSSRIWSHSVETDLPAPQNTDAEARILEISTTGKYLLVNTYYSSWPNYYYDLLLYKGSYV